MEKNEKAVKSGAGKFVVIEKLKQKYAEVFVTGDETGSAVTGSSLLMEGIHFSLVYFPLAHLGYKAVVSSISDIFGKGGRPSNISVNLGISTRHTVDDIEAIFQGVEYACKNYSLKLTDIHVESSLTGLTIAVHSTGVSESDYLPHPAENDLICVTGNLGAAFLGLHILERERKVFEETDGAQPQLEGYEFIIGKQLKPDLPVRKLSEVLDAGIRPSSLLVTREGISSDLIGLCRGTSTGCRVYAEKIPVAIETARTAQELGIEPVTSTLNGGDDFEFIFTVPLSDSDKVISIEGVSVIGHIAGAGDGCHLVLQDGSLAELRAPGWEE